MWHGPIERQAGSERGGESDSGRKGVRVCMHTFRRSFN